MATSFNQHRTLFARESSSGTTDHCERICRRPAGRVIIGRSRLAESDVADFIKVSRVSRTLGLNNDAAIAVDVRELKSHVFTERLFAVVSKFPDDIANEQSQEYPINVEAFGNITPVHESDLKMPTPDYSSPSSETEDTESFGSRKDDTFDTLDRISTPEHDYVEEIPTEISEDITNKEENVEPGKLVRKGLIKRSKKKNKADVESRATLSEPEDLGSVNDEIQRITKSISSKTVHLDLMSCVPEEAVTAKQLNNKKAMKTFSTGNNHNRIKAKVHTMASKHSVPDLKAEYSQAIDISFQTDVNGYGFELLGGRGLTIASVKPGCPADLAGLEAMDVIIKVNGVAIAGRSLSDTMSLLHTALPFIKLSVERKKTKSADYLTRRFTLGAPASLLLPKNQKESDTLCKGTKILTLEMMHKKAVEELKKANFDYMKHPTEDMHLRMKNAQKVLDSLTAQLSGFGFSATRTLQSGRLSPAALLNQGKFISTSPADFSAIASSPSGTLQLPKDTGARGPFTNFLTLRGCPNHLAAFFHFIITKGHDPAAAFFTMIAEEYTIGASVREMIRWAREIYATFLASHAPLMLNVDSGMVASIKKILMQSPDKETELNELRSLFVPPLHFIQTEINKLLNAFCDQKIQDGEFDNNFRYLMSNEEELAIGKKHLSFLWKLFKQHLNIKTMRSQAIASCITVFFNQYACNFNTTRTDIIESCPSFILRDKKANWLKLYKKGLAAKNHSLTLLSWFDLASCDACNEVIWTAFNHGFRCQGCGVFIHRDCINQMKRECSGLVRSRTRSRSREKPGLLRRTLYDSGVIVETQLSKAARRSEVTNSVFHVPLTDAETASQESGDELQNLNLKAEASSVAQTARTEHVSPPVSRNNSVFTTNKPMLGQSFSSSVRRKSGPIDPDMDIEAELPALDAVIPKEELRKMKQKERKRQEVINELFYTERVHVCKLKVLLKFFFRPMLAKNLISREFACLLFPNIEDIFNIHRHASDNFKSRRKENVVVSHVGDILLKHLSGERGEHMQQACAKFCRDQSYALEQLRVLNRRDPKLNSFLQEVASNPLCGRQELRDLLLCEMQRLVKYPLLIDTLLKHTQQDTEEYKQLVKASEQARDLLHFVNEEVRDQENWRRTVYIARRLDKKSVEGSDHPVLVEFKDLDITMRRLIHEGELTWRVSSAKTVQVYVVLFDDIILLLHRQDDKFILKCQSAQLAAGTRHNHIPIIRLRDLLVREYAADKCAFFLVSASRDGSQNVSQYDLVAKTKDDRKKWFGLISNAVEAYKRQPARIHIRHLKAENVSLTPADSDVSPQIVTPDAHLNLRQISNSSSAFSSLSLDMANCLMENEVPDLIQPNEVVCSTVTHLSESVIEQTATLSSDSVHVKRKLSSVYLKLNEKRKLFARILVSSTEEPDHESSEDLSFDNLEPADLIMASVEQVRKLQQLLSVSSESSSVKDYNDDSSSRPPGTVSTQPRRRLTRGLLTSSQRTHIGRQLQYHETLLMSLDLADGSERDHVLSDIQESQRKINSLIDSFNVQAHVIQQSNLVSQPSFVLPFDLS